MVNTVPADPSNHLLPQGLKTPLSVERAVDLLRHILTPRSNHVDGVPGPPIPGRVPVLVDFDNLPPVLIASMGGDANLPLRKREMAGKVVALFMEHLANRCMNFEMLIQWPWCSQNLHRVYNNFTVCFAALLVYMFSFGTFDCPIASAYPRISSLPEAMRLDARRLVEYIVRRYPRLNGGCIYLGKALTVDEIMEVNLETFMDETRRRLRRGIYSAAWLHNEQANNRGWNAFHTQGLLYQQVMVLGKISQRFDDVLMLRHRWNITAAQAALMTNLPNTKLFNPRAHRG